MSTFPVDLTFKNVAEDGRIEVSGLTDVDVALANKIGSVINRLYVSDPEHPRNKRLADFAKRPLADKIAMGEFDSPRRFLRALMKQGKDKISLPCLYITRDPAIAFAELDQYRDRAGVGELCDSDGVYIGEVEESVTTLAYMVNIVGWQDDNIEIIALLLMSWLRHRHADHKFNAKTVLGGAAYDLAVEIIDRHMMTADNASLPFEDDKMRVLSIGFTVNAQTATIRYGSETLARIEQGESHLL